MNLSKKLALIPLALSLLITSTTSLLVSSVAFGAQHVDKAYLDNVTVNVSSTEQNALVVQGRKITSVIPSIADALEY